MTAIMSTTPITTTTIAAAPKTNCGFAKLELESYNSLYTLKVTLSNLLVKQSAVKYL
jgi:hypothetical protein